VFETRRSGGPLDRLADGRLRSAGRRALEAALEAQLGQRTVDFHSVIGPQLGNPFVEAITRDGGRVGALRLRDPLALRRAVEQRLDKGGLERLDGFEGALVWRERGTGRQAATYEALRGAELVVAQSKTDLENAIDASKGSQSLAFSKTFTSAQRRLDRAALVWAIGDARRLLASGDPGQAADARRVPWVRALGIFTLVARVQRSGIGVGFDLSTNRVRLSVRDLPLPPGAASPRLHDPGATAAVAILQPPRLVRFLEQTLRATDPARFARYETGIEQLRSIFGVDLRRDLLDKLKSLSLAASSATAFTFEGALERGTGAAFARNLDRAQPFVEGFLNDSLPGTSVSAQGSGGRRFWQVKNRGLVLARYGVRGDALVGSVGLAGLPRPVRGTRVKDAKGSLVLKGDLARIGRLVAFVLDIPKQALGVVSRLGDLTLGIRTGLQGMRATGRIGVR
jgi:hypothetical protein